MNYTHLKEVLEVIDPDGKLLNIQIIDGRTLQGKHIFLHEKDQAALYGFEGKAACPQFFIEKLSREYPKYLLSLLRKEKNHWRKLEFEGKEAEKILNNSTVDFLFIPAVKSNASLLAFRELVAHLRAPEGCPWDREQDHQTLRTNLLEETYEVLDAIDCGEPSALCEELGDLLLQIVLHAQISNEVGEFGMQEIIEAIHRKITFRHPHVFGDLDVEGVSGVLHNWENLKSQERVHNHILQESILDSIPRNLPALALAQKYQERAARVGFDWPEIAPVLDKIREEIEELKNAKDKETQQAEIGDLLFAMVNLIRWYGLDAESALRKMTRRFYDRFREIEKKASSQGQKVSDLSLEEMDAIWELAKASEVKTARSER